MVLLSPAGSSPVTGQDAPPAKRERAKRSEKAKPAPVETREKDAPEGRRAEGKRQRAKEDGRRRRKKPPKGLDAKIAPLQLPNEDELKKAVEEDEKGEAPPNVPRDSGRAPNGARVPGVPGPPPFPGQPGRAGPPNPPGRPNPPGQPGQPGMPGMPGQPGQPGMPGGMPGMPPGMGGMPGMPGGLPPQGGGFGFGRANPAMPGMAPQGGQPNPPGGGGFGGGVAVAPYWGQSDPELMKLDAKDKEFQQKTYELAEQIKRMRMMGDRVDKSKLDELIRDLEDAVAEHFEVRQARRKLKLKRLQQELAKAKEAIDKREKNREAIIERHITELIGREEELDF